MKVLGTQIIDNPRWLLTFRSKQVLRMFPTLTPRQLQYWQETKLVVPKIKHEIAFNKKLNRKAPDVYRAYFYEQVMVLGVFAELRKHGMSLPKLRKVSKKIKRVISGLRSGKVKPGWFWWFKKKKMLARYMAPRVERYIVFTDRVEARMNRGRP